MKPIDPSSPGAFVNIAEGQSQYHMLPARINGDEVRTRWRLSFRERLSLLFGKPLNIDVLTFGSPLQPLLPYVHNKWEGSE
jgi:hypothetical protein